MDSWCSGVLFLCMQMQTWLLVHSDSASGQRQPVPVAEVAQPSSTLSTNLMNGQRFGAQNAGCATLINKMK